ncbi:urease accessory protein UreD [Corynebacterium sp.]|uniref:urease accessory protein UreD n=1 Tax=Corynebacterium sp. TaxID=1720 RepID=UPI0019A6F8BC|nr:urease accessory protein UreD [Corynebacterium sp.]HHU66554.1 urease accessory protein UreD [Corynebacterium sp.]
MTHARLGFSAATLPEVAGELWLTVAPDGGRTRPVKTEGHGVLRLMRPLYLDDTGQLTYVIVNPGGAYFGEDYRIKADLAPGSALLLASQGATRIYRTPERPAVQDSEYLLEDGSRLEYISEQTIAYRDAEYHQNTRVTAAETATGYFDEIVTPGWSPDDTPFSYAGMRLRTEVRAEDGRLVCLDNLHIRPRQIGHAIDGIGYLEGSSHMGSALILGPHTLGGYVDAIRAVVDGHDLERAGVTSGSRHGVSWVMVRALANSTDALRALLTDVNQWDRSTTTGQGRLDLRRY